MTSIEEYPKIIPADIDSLAKFLQRIVEIRDDDISIINKLLSEVSYNTGFAKTTNEFITDETIGRSNIYNDVDASSGNITISLDPDPIDGQTYYIAKSDATGNTVTVSGNGKTINGGASLVLAARYDTIMIVYMGNADEWRRWI